MKHQATYRIRTAEEEFKRLTLGTWYEPPYSPYFGWCYHYLCESHDYGVCPYRRGGKAIPRAAREHKLVARNARFVRDVLCFPIVGLYHVNIIQADDILRDLASITYRTFDQELYRHGLRGVEQNPFPNPFPYRGELEQMKRWVASELANLHSEAARKDYETDPRIYR